jgi:phospholipid transport system substrate-binding protein
MKKMWMWMLGAVLAAASAAVQADVAKAPDALIGGAVQEVIDALGKDKALRDGDKQKVREIIEAKVVPLFDFTRMTQKTLGKKNWNAATPEQRTALTQEYHHFLVRFYTGAFSSYQDQKVEIKPLKLADSDSDVTVKSIITKPGNQPVTVSYDLYKTSAGWKIYDVAVQEIGLIDTYKKQFAEKIEQSGLDGLIKWLADSNQGAQAKKASAK